MTLDNKFYNALQNVMQQECKEEFEMIPQDDDDINYIFSDSFDQRMSELIKNQKESAKKGANSAFKRAAIIAAAILIFLATPLSVKAIREPIVEFIIEVYESFSNFIFSGDTQQTITYEYGFSSVPEGFKEVNIQNDIVRITITYENGEGDIMELTQSITDDIDLSIDNENGEITEVIINNNRTVIYKSEGTAQANWIAKGYLLTLTYYGDIDIDTLCAYIKAIE